MCYFSDFFIQINTLYLNIKYKIKKHVCFVGYVGVNKCLELITMF
jgi:hypothetical protein